ncbi:hypothetical protein NE237_013483 [Protea cynaroides]|uniref:Pentatricopeptide repeat-containing protein n=1 Tax=Protea cynaroides TaxID=273540 RepID=A0A9Q0GZZ8_9MAGN|nr:hypothetical protein NE237_013483 [Protea cynaroides]
MPNRNTVYWTVLMLGYDQCEKARTALHLFSPMLSQDPVSPPNHFTYASALSACAKQECLSLGMQLHSHVFWRGFVAYVLVSNVLISFYIGCWQVLKLSWFFRKLLNLTKSLGTRLSLVYQRTTSPMQRLTSST